MRQRKKRELEQNTERIIKARMHPLATSDLAQSPEPLHDVLVRRRGPFIVHKLVYIRALLPAFHGPIKARKLAIILEHGLLMMRAVHKMPGERRWGAVEWIVRRASDDADGRAPELLEQGTIELVRWGWGSRRASKVCATGLARRTEDEFRRHTFAQMAHKLLHAALPNAGLVHRKVIQLQVDIRNLDLAECGEGRARP